MSSVYFAVQNAGLIGLALTYAVSLNGMFQYCVRQSAEVENLVRKQMLIDLALSNLHDFYCLDGINRTSNGLWQARI